MWDRESYLQKETREEEMTQFQFAAWLLLLFSVILLAGKLVPHNAPMLYPNQDHPIVSDSTIGISKGTEPRDDHMSFAMGYHLSQSGIDCMHLREHNHGDTSLP